jgi:protein-ribulosamine 3-kinase
MPDWQQIFDGLGDRGIAVVKGATPRPVGGGDISSAWRIETPGGPVFLKTGPADSLDMFQGEAEGLGELAGAGALRVPRVHGHGVSGATAWLALEWITFGPPAADTEAILGRQLAQQHRHTSECYGWRRDNTIGVIPQINLADDDWVRFWRERRLLVQLQLADSHGFGGELLSEGARLARRMDGLFDGYRPEPSLLHGDLWGGNWASADGIPVVFDPAVYYGDRETDLAMTRLFGGFGAGFYRAYREEWPLAEGHERRLPLYQLYHVLNHLNIFGGAYHDRALSLVRELNSYLT